MRRGAGSEIAFATRIKRHKCATKCFERAGWPESGAELDDIQGVGHGKLSPAGIELTDSGTYVTEFHGKTTLDRMTRYDPEQLLKTTGTALGGPFDECKEQGWTLLPGPLFVFKNSFGLVDEASYLRAKSEILKSLQQNMPIDVCYLQVHGAGIVENISDLEGDLAHSVREVVGPQAKICSSADLHGKVTPLMASEYDFFNAWKEYPHSDFYECSRDALRNAAKAFFGEIKPVFNWQKIPLMLGTSSTMVEGAFNQKLKNKCIAYEQLAGVLNCSAMHGFPYQDTHYCGMYTLVTTDGDDALGKRINRELAPWIWDNRASSNPPAMNVQECLEKLRALQASKGRYVQRKMGEPSSHTPAVIADTGDNPGGGAPGDTTHLLRGLMEGGDLGKIVFMSIHDEETVKQAIAAGVGSTIEVRLGGKYDFPRGGSPIEGKAYVKSISDGKDSICGPMLYGVTFNLGPMVRLQMNNIDVIVVSGLGQAFDDAQCRPLGILVEEYDVVCVKSSAHWRAFYSHISANLLVADSPGMTCMDLNAFDHSKLSGPIYPLDINTSFTPA